MNNLVHKIKKVGTIILGKEDLRLDRFEAKDEEENKDEKENGEIEEEKETKEDTRFKPEKYKRSKFSIYQPNFQKETMKKI